MRRKKTTGRFIVILDGPSKVVATGENTVRYISEDGERAHIYSSIEDARSQVRDHIMAPFVTWILDVDTGETETL